jgi:hypothetical protein
LTLNWLPTTDLRVSQIADEFCSHALIDQNEGSRVRVIEASKDWHPGEIKVDHCYSMTPINGPIARVIKLFNISAMSAYENIKRGAPESLTMNPTVVRFVWRHASYPKGWSKSQQQLLLDKFALAAEEEVACR